MTYRDQLLAAYEGEVIGCTFFSELAKAAESADAKRKLHFLAGLETRTAALLAPLMERHNLTPRPMPDLVAEGVRDAGRYAGLSWPALNAKFAADFPPYVDEFVATEALAPSRDLPVCKLVTLHEIALVEFAREEMAGTGFGMGHLQSYLSQLEMYQADLLSPAGTADGPA
jgi:hypothetical protein